MADDLLGSLEVRGEILEQPSSENAVEGLTVVIDTNENELQSTEWDSHKEFAGEHLPQCLFNTSPETDTHLDIYEPPSQEVVLLTEENVSSYDLLGSIDNDPTLLANLRLSRKPMIDNVSVYTFYSSEADSEDDEVLKPPISAAERGEMAAECKAEVPVMVDAAKTVVDQKPTAVPVRPPPPAVKSSDSSKTPGKPTPPRPPAPQTKLPSETKSSAPTVSSAPKVTTEESNSTGTVKPGESTSPGSNSNKPPSPSSKKTGTRALRETAAMRAERARAIAAARARRMNKNKAKAKGNNRQDQANPDKADGADSTVKPAGSTPSISASESPPDSPSMSRKPAQKKSTNAFKGQIPGGKKMASVANLNWQLAMQLIRRRVDIKAAEKPLAKDPPSTNGSFSSQSSRTKSSKPAKAPAALRPSKSPAASRPSKSPSRPTKSPSSHKPEKPPPPSSGPTQMFPFGANKAALPTGKASLASAFDATPAPTGQPAIPRSFSSEFLNGSDGHEKEEVPDLLSGSSAGVGAVAEPFQPNILDYGLDENADTRDQPDGETAEVSVVEEQRSRLKSEEDKSEEDGSEEEDDEDSEESDSCEKSAQWKDFEAMTARISSNLQQTQAKLQKITANTNINKIKDGVIKEKEPDLPLSNVGAWEHIDALKPEKASGGQSHGFEDVYDPADKLALAFGGNTKPETEDSCGFTDAYEPQVAPQDELADAFGDGFRVKKVVYEEHFDDSFCKSADGKETESKALETESKELKMGGKELATAGKEADTEETKEPAEIVSAAQDVEETTVSDLINILDDEVQPVIHSPSDDNQMDNGGIAEVNVDMLLDLVDYTAQSTTDPFPAISPPAYCEPSGSPKMMSSGSSIGSEEQVLDAFSMFAPSDQTQTGSTDEPDTVNVNADDSITDMSLSGPKGLPKPVLINIIEASFDHPSSEDEDKIVQNHHITNTDLESQNVANMNGTAEGTPGTADDDFEALLNRPSAEKIENLDLSEVKSTLWQETAAEGDQFKADFTAKEPPLNSSSAAFVDNSVTFPGSDPFSLLVESAADASEDINAGMSSDMHFAHTFSTTVEEPDEEGQSGLLLDIEGQTSSKQEGQTSSKQEGQTSSKQEGQTSSKQEGQTTNKQSPQADAKISPEDEVDAGKKQDSLESSQELPNDGQLEDGSDEASIRKVSLMDVEVDMNKPMPMPDRLTSSKGRMAKKKRAETPKPQPSSIHLVSQTARKVLQTKTKPVPRPQGKKLVEETSEAVVAEPLESKEVKKLLTQGEADILTLPEQEGTVSLNFAIAKNTKKTKKKIAAAAAADIPRLPPPSITLSPARTRKVETSESESEDEPVKDLVTDSVVVDQDYKESSGQAKSDTPAADPESVWKFEEPDLPPLDPYREPFTGHGWNVMLRKPPKKSLTKKRFWEEVYIRLQPNAKGVPALQFYRNEKDARKEKEGESNLRLQEISLNPCHRLTDSIALQQYDHYGKCYCIKLYHVFYKERPGLRSDRVAEALPSFLRGYMRPKGKMVFEHASQKTELCKLASVDSGVIKSLLGELQDSLMVLKDVRLNANTMYQKDEISADVWDEYEAYVDKQGRTVTHKCRIRLYMLCFLSGMPMVEVGINERRRRGKEVVGRKDIIPVKADSWITVENPEFHPIVKQDVFDETGILRFSPLDGSKFEIMRFRYRPKKNRELPLQLQAKMIIDVKKRIIEIRGDAMVPGYYSNSKRKGQVPCQDIQICFPVPEDWIYKFRVEKHFKYGSLHAASRRPGKIKGMERITTAMGKAVENYLPPSFIECSTGDAKYEHVFKSVVWRIDRLPGRNQGAYKSHYFALRINLEPHDTIPDNFQPNVSVSFTMPHTTVSGTAIRSISLTNMATDDPPEKWVHHHARFDMEVEIEFGTEVKEYLPSEYPDSDSEQPSPKGHKASSKATAEAAEEDEFEDGNSSEMGSSSEDGGDEEEEDDDEDEEKETEYSAMPAAAAADSGAAVDTLICFDDNEPIVTLVETSAPLLETSVPPLETTAPPVETTALLIDAPSPVPIETKTTDAATDKFKAIDVSGESETEETISDESESDGEPGNDVTEPEKVANLLDL